MPAPDQIEDLKKAAQLGEHGHPTIQQNLGSSSGNAATFATASPNDPYNRLIRALGLPLPCPPGFLERCKREMTPETCEWLQQQPEFEEWVEGGNQILWVVGGSGTGKTMLSVSTVEHLKTQIRSRDALPDQEKEQGFLPDALAYCFCDPTERNTPSAIIGGLLRQLIETYRKPLKNNMFDGVSYDADALFEVFESVLRELGSHFRHIYILLDGLDECDGSPGKSLAGSLCRLMIEDGMKTKLLVTSQLVYWIREELDARNIPLFHINKTNIVGDIQKTIKHKVRKADLDVKIGSQRRQKLQDHLLENSGDTFLWADLVIKNLDDAEHTPKNLEFDEVTNEIPSELNSVYDRIMINVYRRILENRYSLDEVDFVLQFVTVARRDLTADEIDMAFATWKNKTTGGPTIIPDLGSIKTRVYESCIPLVSFDSETKVVYFMHKSVATYLSSARPYALLGKILSGTLHRYNVAPRLDVFSNIFRLGDFIFGRGSEPESSSGPPRRPPEAMIRHQRIQVDRSRANFLVLDVCLRYLDMCGLDNDEKMSRYERGLRVGLEDLKEQHPEEKESNIFIGYAREYWQDHALAMMDFEQAIQELRKLSNMPMLRDRLLLRAAESGHDRVLRILLKEMGASPMVEDRDGKSALHLAALGGHVATVQLLLDHGADPDQRDSAGATALHLAAGGGKISTFTQLFALHKKHRQKQEEREARNNTSALLFLSRQWLMQIRRLIFGAWFHSMEDDTGVTVDVEVPDKKGGTLLAWALESGSKEVIEFLLVNDAKTDIRYFRDPRRTNLSKTDLKLAINYFAELFEDLLETLEISNPNQRQRTPLARAAERGLGDVVELLLDYKADPNFKDASGRAAVFWAAKSGHEGIIETLKEQGADCNSQLRLAVLRKQVPAIRRLIQKGEADPNWEDERGLSPVGWAAVVGDKDVMEALLESGRADTESKATKYRFTPLVLAAQYGENDVIEPLINKGKANVNWVDETTSTPLMWAANRSHNDVVKSILASGKADLGHTNKIGRTALMETAMAGNEEAFSLLMQQEKNVNRTDAFGRSAIFHAIRGGNRRIIDTLLSRPELDIWTPDFYGATCLSIAARFGDNSTIRELLGRGNNNHKNLLSKMIKLLSHRDNFGRSPIAWAVIKGHSSTGNRLVEQYNMLRLSTGRDELILPQMLSSTITTGPQVWPQSFCDVCFFNISDSESYYTCGLCFMAIGYFVCCQECWTTLKPQPKCKGPRHKLYLRMKNGE
ncbi:hypothetical protein RRF57_001298 [Xylaria bambusicola]|uniref:Nephrocystin 3-like N-terminal domain-containing protein n=1 Tax=Xylaria bambusicola TaxID=326684 RepID=A0AAN7Z1H1_9PEZI